MMENNSNNYISLQEATQYCNYSREYLSLRARQRKLKAVKIGRDWVTRKEWLEEYLVKTNNNKNNHLNNLKDRVVIALPPSPIGFTTTQPLPSPPIGLGIIREPTKKLHPLKAILISIFIGFTLSFFLFYFLIYAAPPGSPYNPGETLSPTCAPGSPNCTVYPPVPVINNQATIGEDKPAGTPNTAGAIKLFSAGDNAFYTTLTAATQTANADYTLPTALPDANKVLQSTPAGVLSWVASGVGAHNLLSATHLDTTVGAVVRGDLITGQGVAPTWTKLALGTVGKILRSDGTDLLYSTATYPDTTTINQLLYSSAANTVTGLATANSGVLVTNATGVPSILGSMTNGQLVIGSTGATPVLAVLSPTASEIDITNAAGSITIGIVDPLAVGKGGTGIASWTQYAIPYLSAATTFSEIAIGGANQILTVNGTATGYTWVNTVPATAHNLLSATHGDTAAAAVVRGDIIIGNATPAWSRLAKGSAGQLVTANANDVVWTTATYPATTTAYQILYSSLANTVTGLSTGNNGVLVTDNAGVPSILAGPGMANKILMSSAAAAPVWSTATYPATATTTGAYLRADGTNWITSTLILPNAGTAYKLAAYTSANTLGELVSVGSTGQILQANTGAIPTWSTATYPATATTAGTILRADGTNWAASTTIWPNSITDTYVLVATAANTIGSDSGLTFEDATDLLTIGGDLLVNGGDIGLTADTDLMQLALNALTVNGTITVNEGAGYTSQLLDESLDFYRDGVSYIRAMGGASADLRFTTGGTGVRWVMDSSGHLWPYTDSAFNFGSTTRYIANTYTDRLYLNSTAYLDGATAGDVGLTGTVTQTGNYYRYGKQAYISGGNYTTADWINISDNAYIDTSHVWHLGADATETPTLLQVQSGGVYLYTGTAADPPVFTQHLAMDSNGDWIPWTDSARSLGTSSKYWANTYTDRLYLNSTAYLDGASAGNIQSYGNIIPTSASGYSLGSTTLEWANLYIGTGRAYFGAAQERSIYDYGTTGTLAIAGLAAGSGAALQYSTTDYSVYYVVSSERYKEDIKPFTDDFAKILEAEPKSFTFKAGQIKDIGYIAEDFQALGLTNLLYYDAEGLPTSIKYDKIPLYLVEVAKAQKKEIEDIKLILGLKDQVEGGETLTELTSTSPSFIEQVRQALAALGLFIENGVAKIQKIFADFIETGNLKVGSREKPTGITIYDEETSEPYCLKIKNGQVTSIPGECSDSPSNETLSTPSTDTPSTDEPAESPSDIPADEQPQIEEPPIEEPPAPEPSAEEPPAPEPAVSEPSAENQSVGYQLAE